MFKIQLTQTELAAPTHRNLVVEYNILKNKQIYQENSLKKQLI